MQNPRRVTKPKSTTNTHVQMCQHMERERTYIIHSVIASSSMELATKILRQVACIL